MRNETKCKIDRLEFVVKEQALTGAEIRRLPNEEIGKDRDLFMVVPGGSDLRVELDDLVEIGFGKRFFTVPHIINAGHCDYAGADEKGFGGKQ